MEFGKAVSFPFNDPDWLKKIAITGLIGLIPIVGQLYVFGWGIEILRRALSNPNAVMLPEEVDFGGFLRRGFQGFVVSFVYALPMIIANSSISGVSLIPVDGSGGDAQTMQTVVMVISSCCGCLAFIFSIIYALMMPAALAKYAIADSIGAGLKIGEVFAMVKAAIGPYLLLVVFQFVIGLAVALGSVITCLLGIIILSPLATAIQSHLYAQAYQKAREAGAV